MAGLMRKKFASVKGTLVAIGFSLVLPFGGGPAHALPRKPPQSAPMSMPSSMKLKEPKLEEDQTPIVASFRAGTGSMVRGMLRAKLYKKLVALHKRLNRGAPASQPVRSAKEGLAEESKILAEAKSFEDADRLNCAVASVFLSAKNLLVLKSRESKLVDAYLANITSLGFPKLAEAARQWLKNGKGDLLTLYKGMRSCLPNEG